MVKVKQYTVNGIEFRTQSDLVEYVRAILRRYSGDCEALDADDFVFMLALLGYHPEARDKIGCGVESMYVADNPIYPGPKSRGFHVRRLDGTETDFSYRECIQATPHDRKVIAAMRAAVEPDTIAFKQAAFDAAGGLVRCPDTGALLSFTTAHVDHKAPLTFDKLVRAFLCTEGFQFDEIALVPSGDNQYQDQLADDGIRQRWIAYHRSHAELEVVSMTANLSLRKKQVSL